MKTAMLGLLAETPIHPGAGRGMGVVDLPVAREAATEYPVLVGSSLKGALRDKLPGDGSGDEAKARFGAPDQAGDLLVSDARLLLLPVRSLTGSYRWATCPHLVERYRRDLLRAGFRSLPAVPEVAPGCVLTSSGSNTSAGEAGDAEAAADGHTSGDLFLEERQFTIAGSLPDGLTDSIAPLLLHEDTSRRVPDRLAVLHDDDFAWFARYGLPILARNRLDDAKRSRNLWYEETLPPDTVLYALVAGRSGVALGSLDALFPEDDPYLQAGGNETVGQGWFAVTVCRSDPKETAR